MQNTVMIIAPSISSLLWLAANLLPFDREREFSAYKKTSNAMNGS